MAAGSLYGPRLRTERQGFWGTWVAQRVRASAFGSGYDLRVLRWSPALGSLLSGEPTSLSLSLSAYLFAYLKKKKERKEERQGF